MFFWGILAGGFLGVIAAVKSKVPGTWIFLVCSIFSTYSALILAPEVFGYIKDYNSIPLFVKTGGVPVLLYIIFMIITDKIFKAAAGEEGDFDAIADIGEKLFNCVAGLFSGMILAAFVMFCFFAAFPGLLDDKDPQIRKNKIGIVQNYASNLLKTGNILTFSSSHFQKQEARIKTLLPVPEEKKRTDKVSKMMSSVKKTQETK